MKRSYKEPKERDGWFVYECGQNPCHCCWYCILCSFTLKDSEGKNLIVCVEDYDTFSEALNEANKLTEKKEKTYKGE
ncbi:MAG: hypothetical protein NC222_06925 [Staphylococcus sp.]|nr:hypothetical protein [Staphylococcus sp.]